MRIAVVYPGPSGDAFELSQKVLCLPGLNIVLLAHPLATEEDLNTLKAQESHGCITLLSENGDTAAADYHGGEAVKRLALQR